MRQAMSAGAFAGVLVGSMFLTGCSAQQDGDGELAAPPQQNAAPPTDTVTPDDLEPGAGEAQAALADETTAEPETAPSVQPDPALEDSAAQLAATATPSCAVAPHTVTLGTRDWSRTVTFPAKGRLAGESHIATPEDGRPDCTMQSGINAHIDRSCAVLTSRYAVRDCGAIYTLGWRRVWTPAEPICGRGASVPPPVEAEMFILNMMFKPGSVPPPGEKWLVCNDAKAACVVAAAGYEIGPGAETWLGGVQGEVHHFLKATNATELTVHGPLQDQSLNYGPIECGDPS